MRTRGLRVAGIALAAALACESPPTQLPPDAQDRVDDLLRPYRDKLALSEFVGALPAVCLQNTPDTELCEWRAGNALPGWRALAAAIGTGDRVNLICELPLDGSEREGWSCTVHPRRSNRYAWSAPRVAAEPSEPGAEKREIAGRWIEDARNLSELSRLMGALPDQCAAGAAGELVCLWRTTEQTFGHGTLVVWIEAPKRKKIRLRCAVPDDGSPRRRESCQAEVGA